MSCLETISAYAFRSLGYGPRALPSGDQIGLCEQFTLIGSGMIWNVYFGVVALALGFVFATALAVARLWGGPWTKRLAGWYVFIFRGSPLFIQFFLIYEALVMLPRAGISLGAFTIQTNWVTSAWAGATLTLFLNTSAYASEIFYGALKSVPKGDVEAADAYGMTGWTKFRRVIWPTTLRLAWPAYTNEAIFLFQATALVFFSSFPAYQQRGDALYYAKYFADKTFDPFVPYPIAALYFILATLVIIAIFGVINRRLNRHLPGARRPKLRIRPQIVR